MNSRYNILFEPLHIGPVKAPNRFYQVPHCTGMGFTHPNTLAAMRATKAEGGWGVVCTEYCSMHPTSDDTPYPHLTLWDEQDVRNMSLMTDAVHQYNSLAGVELWHGGTQASNLYSRSVGLGAQSMPVNIDPIQTRAMDLEDIKNFRQWHRDAVLRAKRAQFDIVYVYACHGYLLAQFLSRTNNTRVDEYGGSLENRMRLIKEILEDTCEIAENTMAVAIRFAVSGIQDKHFSPDEAKETVELLSSLPDLWDITVSDYDHEMGSSRFIKEGSLEDQISWVKKITQKPVVSVGRFTSPDTMVRQIESGILDFIGAARPSIADPFLPQKIRENKLDEIRECIGCNICYSGDSRSVPIRCTQNPAIGEEWRRGWHPENVDNDCTNTDEVLVVGAGPSGLEAGHILAKRGYNVTVAESKKFIGGRVTLESQLPGLNEWLRVIDYRLNQIDKLNNIKLFLNSHMTLHDITEFDAEHVIIATGANWRRNGMGRSNPHPVTDIMHDNLLTPDDIMSGNVPNHESVLVYDDDHYYMGTVIAEKLAETGCNVSYVTTESVPGAWSENTGEQGSIHRKLLSLGINIINFHNLVSFNGYHAEIECLFSGSRQVLESDKIVSVTSREPNQDLYLSLKALNQFQSLTRIGDCDAPGIIAMAIYAGHLIGRNLGKNVGAPLRDRVMI
mgnify:CR=1 FL=1